MANSTNHPLPCTCDVREISLCRLHAAAPALLAALRRITAELTDELNHPALHSPVCVWCNVINMARDAIARASN